MRIAYLATSYPSSPGDASGHFVRAEALTAARQGHDVHVVAPAPRADPEVTAHPVGGDRLFQWPGAVARTRERPSRLFSLAPFLVGAARTLARLQADRVVAHWLLPCAYPLLLADEVVCHGADVRLLLGLPRPLREHVVKATLRRADLVRFVAVSLRDGLADGLGSSLRRRLLEQSLVVPPSVDVTELDGASRPAGRYVVAAGRLVADKRFSWAVRACHLRAVPLLLLGDGPEEASLRALAAGLGADVTFVGRVPRPRALGLLRGAAALIHPSISEAAPTIVLEARALGVPVVATPSGDLARWAEADPGLRLADDEPGLARELGGVLDRCA